MKKIQLLRQHLEQVFPFYAQNPEQMLLFIDSGNIACTMAKGFSFEYRYKAHLILTDFADDIDIFSVALLDFLRIHQSELLVNLDNAKKAITFEADIVDNSKVDLSFTLELSERVIVKKNGEQLEIDHPLEPQYTQAQAPTAMTLQDSHGTTLAQWQSIASEDEYFLETKWTGKND